MDCERTHLESGGGDVPIVDRPRVPPIYGIPDSREGLLDWAHVSVRMEKALIYWVTTVSPNGRPHATPVDGVWFGDALYFGGDAGTRWRRNLARNPAVCVHLESGTDVVILHGDVEEIPHPDRSLALFLTEASNEKYGYGPPPEAYQQGGVSVLRPRKVLAWRRFPGDATRFRFPDR